MSCWVPTGPFTPRSGYRASRSSTRCRAWSSSSPALANRLPRVVAWAGTLWVRPGHHQAGVLGGPLGQAGQRGEHPAPHEHERPPDLELLDVLGQIPGGHPLVDLLVAGEGGELVDPGLHVVTCDTFPRLDRLEVDLVDHLPVGLDGLVGHRDPEVALGLEDRQPQLPLQHHLVLGRPQPGHVGAGVAGGEHVRHAGAGHRSSSTGGPDPPTSAVAGPVRTVARVKQRPCPADE